MSNVQELERQLADAKKQEIIDNLNTELLKHIHLKNKCYATHLFGRKSFQSIDAKFRKITDVIIKDNKIRYEIENITYHKHMDGMLTFEVATTYSSEPHHWYESFRYEIPLGQYETIKNQVTAQIDIIGDSIRSILKSPDDYIRQGEYSDEQVNEELILASKCPLIHLEEEPYHKVSVRELLVWNKHPLVISGKYLVNNKYSKLIAQNIVDELIKGARSWGGSIYDRDMPRAEKLQEFINKTDWFFV